ncbi:MAG TPA: Gfo/Idh/MocA family oxidoreductase [Polyangia bacterium]
MSQESRKQSGAASLLGAPVIRWGIIGCGDVCEVKSGPAFQKAPGSALVAVMRRDRDKAADFARRHGVPRFYSDADALIADPEVDAIYVATPPSSHAAYTLAAARAGKPVYVEKPMATDRPACTQMIEACTAAGVPLFVAYYRRALPRFLKVKQLLEEGAIGKVRAVTTTLITPTAPAHHDPNALPWRVQPEIAGGGLFVDLASHTLDLLDFLLGPITRAEGAAVTQAGLYAAEDTVSARLAFASGVPGVGLWCFVAGTRIDRTEIHGERGTIRFATFDEGPVELCGGTAEAQRWEIPHPPHIQQPLIELVVAALRTGGASPSTGETAARTNAVMDDLLATHRAGRAARSA